MRNLRNAVKRIVREEMSKGTLNEMYDADSYDVLVQVGKYDNPKVLRSGAPYNRAVDIAFDFFNDNEQKGLISNKYYRYGGKDTGRPNYEHKNAVHFIAVLPNDFESKKYAIIYADKYYKMPEGYFENERYKFRFQHDVKSHFRTLKFIEGDFRDY